MEKLEQLKGHLAEVTDLNLAAMVLTWDQNTYMPTGGEASRARQLATLGRLAHERATDPAVGRMLDELEPLVEHMPYDSDAASLVRVARRDYERAVRVPGEFVARFEAHQAESFAAWARARPANDFAAVRPYLEKTVDLSREYAGYFDYDHIADPLIDVADYGMKANTIRPILEELRQQLVPLAQAVAAQPPVDDACIHQHFPEREQWAFGLEVIERLGYDFDRGRQDKAPHPFTISFGVGDVRITTRVSEHDLTEALFGTIHESGHAMYEQGVHPDLDGTPLADGTSAGVHESQSRLWENIVGRSRGFWTFFYPRLQEIFTDQLGAVPLETFYRAINKVQPSLIRTSADEVTYDLHIIIRFGLELDLLEGKISVRDMPEIWRARYAETLGITPPDDRDGVMQDIHWYAGAVGGAFQGYSLGNILGAQFFEAAVSAHPEIPAQIERGEFDTLHGWLREHIYQHGRKFTAAELVERVTGGPMRVDPYARYLRAKFGEIYSV